MCPSKRPLPPAFGCGSTGRQTLLYPFSITGVMFKLTMLGYCPGQQDLTLSHFATNKYALSQRASARERPAV